MLKHDTDEIAEHALIKDGRKSGDDDADKHHGDHLRQAEKVSAAAKAQIFVLRQIKSEVFFLKILPQLLPKRHFGGVREPGGCQKPKKSVSHVVFLLFLPYYIGFDYFFRISTPIYLRRTSGTTMEPSAS